jgi:putative transferase (TIGR04331 family)
MRNLLIDSKSEDPFLILFFQLLSTQMPKTYLEDYGCVKKLAKKVFPLFPKVIITGVSHRADDVFKVWAAEHREKGVKLVVNQHGGYYGIGQLRTYDDFDCSIGDYFVTMGWKDTRYSNIMTCPSSKLTSFSHSVSPNLKGKLLLIQLSVPKQPYVLYSVPFGEFYFDYLDDLSLMYKALNDEVLSQICVRLSTSDYGIDLKKYYTSKWPNIDVYKGPKSFQTHLNECRLAIATYNATTYLETLAANYPTIIFWTLKHSPIRAEAQTYFDMLEKVGIFHKSPESAAVFLNKIFDDIPSWWNSSEVQNARAIFCAQFALTDENWVEQWVSLVKNIK